MCFWISWSSFCKFYRKSFVKKKVKYLMINTKSLSLFCLKLHLNDRLINGIERKSRIFVSVTLIVWKFEINAKKIDQWKLFNCKRNRPQCIIYEYVIDTRMDYCYLIQQVIIVRLMSVSVIFNTSKCQRLFTRFTSLIFLYKSYILKDNILQLLLFVQAI